jgi:cell division protein YceG involved in septum cleavage
MYIFLFVIILILIICNIIIFASTLASASPQMHTKFKLKGGKKSTDLTLELKHKVDQLIKNSNVGEYSSKIKNMKQLTNKILNKL